MTHERQNDPSLPGCPRWPRVLNKFINRVESVGGRLPSRSEFSVLNRNLNSDQISVKPAQWWAQFYNYLFWNVSRSLYTCLANNQKTISHLDGCSHFSFKPQNRLNVCSTGKPRISLSSCILKENVDSWLPMKYLQFTDIFIRLFETQANDCSYFDITRTVETLLTSPGNKLFGR